MRNHAPRRRNGWNMSCDFYMLRRVVSDFLTSHDTKIQMIEENLRIPLTTLLPINKPIENCNNKNNCLSRFIFDSGTNSKTRCLSFSQWYALVSLFRYGVATLAEFTQKVPRNSIKFWALYGLFTKQKVPRIFKKCKQTRQGPEFD